MKKIAVFCSASFNISQEYNEVARTFVRAASSRGYGIVTGGTIKGTMGVISDEMRDNGGYHLGVIPRFMNQYVYPELSEVKWTDTMAERKTLLREAGKGVCRLDRTGLSYVGTEDGEEVNHFFPMDSIYRILFGSGENFEIYLGKEIFYFAPTELRSAVDWYIASDILKSI